MPYQIKSFISGFSNEKIVHEKTDSYEDAKVLLNKFKDDEIQRNNKVSEIEDDCFSCIDSLTEQEKIFEISEV